MLLCELIFTPCIESQVYKDYGIKGACQTMGIKYKVLKYRIMPYCSSSLGPPFAEMLTKVANANKSIGHGVIEFFTEVA